MGFSLAAYLLLALSGGWIFFTRQQHQPRPQWLRPAHLLTGIGMVLLVLLLLAIGIVGTLGHYGSLGHSWHLPAGLVVVYLVFLSAWSAVQISPEKPRMRQLHLGVNLLLFLAFLAVSWSGWSVVQKYLP